jgi:hypothetical protein
MSDHTVSLYKDGDEFRIRVDAPGERAVSAPVADPFGFCATVAQEAGLGVAVDTAAGVLHISRNPEDLDTTTTPDADPGAFDAAGPEPE